MKNAIVGGCVVWGAHPAEMLGETPERVSLVEALAPVVAIFSLVAVIALGLLSVRPAPRGRR